MTVYVNRMHIRGQVVNHSGYLAMNYYIKTEPEEIKLGRTLLYKANNVGARTHP